MKANFLTIGELGRRTDTKVQTVRYYEQVGLLPAPARTAGNYRAYDAGHLNRLSFIRRSRELGFSIDQIRALLDLADQRDRSCDAVDAIAATVRLRNAESAIHCPRPRARQCIVVRSGIPR